MAKGTPRTRRTTRAAGIAAARQALLETATTIPPASAVVDASFKEDAKVQQTYSKHFAARAALAIPNALRPETAFKDSRPSQFTQREREPRRYLAPQGEPDNNADANRPGRRCSSALGPEHVVMPEVEPPIAAGEFNRLRSH
jgi:hypothetical protein